MSIKKHIGLIKSTGQRCIIVFMQLPDDKEKALIINVESLAPAYEQMLMDVVNSPEGQQARNLADTLGRRMVSGAGRSVLAEFHARGFMRAESIDNVIVVPRPNTPFPLRDILVQMGALDDVAASLVTESKPDAKFNQHTANLNADTKNERVGMAHNLLMEAEMLQAEANKKRESAYNIAPSLRPTVDLPPIALEDAVAFVKGE